MLNFADFLIKSNKSSKKIIFKEKKLTYSKLYEKVNEISKSIFLKKKNQLIGIRLDTSEEFLILYLSIIKSGNIAVIIEKSLSKISLQKLLLKHKINHIITDIEPSNKKLNKKIYKLDISQQLNSKIKIFYQIKKDSKPQNKIFLNDVAIVLFTSGSTGLKKAVPLTHRNLISNTNSILKVLPIKSTDITNLLLPTSYSFGLSILNTHLKKGASIFLHTSPFVGSIISEIIKYKCTSIYGVPSTFEILIDKTNFIKKNFTNLRYMAQAGGKLDIKYIKILLSKYENKFHVMYGATEASPRLSHMPPKLLKNNLNSIGIPLPGVKFKLFKINKTSKFELGVSGPNIMKGYLNELKFNKHIFKGKYFLTGDIAYKNKNNFYFIEKRIDKIIKRFGYKINLTIIEKTIKKIDYIKNCSLFVNKNNKMICLVLVPRSKLSLVQSDINNVLVKKFASYEIPDMIISKFKEKKFFDKKISLKEIFKKEINEIIK
jgi:acyl-CoA synthetase (AMP-forming)/AMP-acid ligase II